MDRVKVGEKYGKLTILENHHPKDEVVCRCECGNIKIARAYNVFYGLTKSCGCLFKEGNNLKHGFRRTGEKSERLYVLWKAMRERCNTPSCSCYKHYGARGIRVCKEWDNYLAFKEWALSHGYSDELTLDRIDFNGNYEPENCRWATYKQQANNTRANHYLTINGVTKTMTEWSEVSGISAATIWARLHRGWGVKDAVFQPKGTILNNKGASM